MADAIAESIVGSRADSIAGSIAPRKSSLDWFLGDISSVEIDITPELFERMIEHAALYLSAGGMITWERWSMLGAASREAFAEAAARLKIRSALER